MFDVAGSIDEVSTCSGAEGSEATAHYFLRAAFRLVFFAVFFAADFVFALVAFFAMLPS
jgi:hypothetical protein